MATTTHDLKLRAILDVSQVKQQVQQLNSKNTVNLDASGISHSINLLNQTISKFTSSLENLSKNTQQAAVKINNSSNQAVSNWSQIGKFAAGFAVEHIGNKASDYFKAVGNETAASTSDFLSKVGRGVLVGSGAGWIGAAGGAIFGGVEFALEQLADNAKKAAEELAAYQQVLAEARSRDEAWAKYRGNQELKNLVENGTTEDIQKKRDILQRERDYAYSGIKTFESAYGESEPGKGDFEEQAQKYIADLKEQLKKVGQVKAKDAIGTFSKEAALKLPLHNKKLEAAIKEAEEQLKIYQEDKKTIIEHDSVIQTLDSALKQRANAEQQAAKVAEAKAEIERKAIEAEQKRIEIEAQRNEAIIKKLRQTDTEGAESDEISDMLKGGNLQMLNKMLTSVQAKAAWAEAEYNKYLEAGDGDKATEARRQLMRYRGYESSITSGIEGLESKDISKLGEQYSSLLNQLNKVLQPSTSVSELQAQGFGMGWVDAPVDSIEDNVSKIANKMIELIGLIRNTEQDVGSTLW